MVADSDLNFAGVRQWLQADVRQPGFEVIRSRRRSRTHRLTAAGVALAALAAFAGTALAIGGAPDSAPVVTSPTASPEPGSFELGPGGRFQGLTATPWRQLYVLVDKCGPGAPACSPGPPGPASATLMRSDDTAVTWTTVGPVPDRGRLLVGSPAAKHPLPVPN